MGWLMQAIGVGLVLIALIDIYLTVLYPRSNKGWVSVPLSKAVWLLFRRIARTRFWKCDSLLSYCGPTLLIIIVLVWILLPITGFALIVWPGLSSAIESSDNPTPANFATALFYSGCVFTTLGAGDVVPKTTFFRLLALVESALGFSIFTLTITYLLAVYTALAQRNIFALSLHHRTASQANAAEMLARLGTGGDFKNARDEIADMAKSLLTLLESHHSYPVVHYFRFQNAYYSIARITLLTMDTVTLIRSALPEQKYRPLMRSTVVAELGDGGLHLLTELSNSFLARKKKGTKRQSESVLREWYFRAVERLKQEEIETVEDLEAGADLYVQLRQTWEPYTVALAEYMAYDWRDIAPAECAYTRRR